MEKIIKHKMKSTGILIIIFAMTLIASPSYVAKNKQSENINNTFTVKETFADTIEKIRLDIAFNKNYTHVLQNNIEFLIDLKTTHNESTTDTHSFTNRGILPPIRREAGDTLQSKIPEQN
jgi:hypothetical protein